MPLASWKAAIIRSWVSRTGESQPPAQANAPATLSITAPIAPSRTSTPALLTGPAPTQDGFIFIFNVASLTLSYWTRDASLPGPAVCSADVDASSLDIRLPAGIANTENCNSPTQGRRT